MGTNMRVLLVASTLEDDGGAPVYVGQLATALAHLGHAVDIVGQHARDLAPAVVEAGRQDLVTVTGIQSPWTIAGQFAAARRVGQMVSDRNLASAEAGERLVVHTHGVWVLPVIAAGRAARAAAVRHIITPHGMLRRESMRKSFWKKQLALATAVRRQLIMADAVHVTSRAEADDLNRITPTVDPVIIPAGIVPPHTLPCAPAPRAYRVAGYLGRIIPIKNLHTLLYAWRDAAPAGWELRIAGAADPEYAAQLKTLVESLGLADCVRLEPPIPHHDIGRFFAAIDLFILPSKSESFGMSAGEALAAGVPTISTTAAPWQGIADHQCGWWAEPTQSALAQAIREATSQSPTQLAAMGKRAVEWLRSDFSWAAIAQRHAVELYDARGQGTAPRTCNADTHQANAEQDKR